MKRLERLCRPQLDVARPLPRLLRRRRLLAFKAKVRAARVDAWHVAGIGLLRSTQGYVKCRCGGGCVQYDVRDQGAHHVEILGIVLFTLKEHGRAEAVCALWVGRPVVRGRTRVCMAIDKVRSSQVKGPTLVLPSGSSES